MTTNPLLYPGDYANTTDQQTSQANALENAVTLLQTQAVTTAVQQTLTRRALGQGLIHTDNQSFKFKSGLMPLSVVGQQTTVPQAVLGTVAYIAGGRSHGTILTKSMSFFFSNESSSPEGFTLSDQRTYAGTIFNRNDGYWFTGNGYQPIRSIEKISYLQVSVRRTGQEVTVPRIGAAGVGDATRGIVAGGVPTDNTQAATRSADRYTYSTETNAPIANLLSVARFAPHNGASETTNGWLFGGSSAGFNFTGNTLLTIERINLPAGSSSAHGSSLQRPHTVHACAGNVAKAIIAGGIATESEGWFGNDISEFNFATQTASVLSATLAQGRVCADGIGSSFALYILGGDTVTSEWLGTPDIERVVYSTNTSRLLGAKLPSNAADQGAVGDYAATLY
jgi:hypothetical protein